MATSTQPVKRARGGGEGHASRRAVPEVGEVAALHRSRLADEEARELVGRLAMTYDDDSVRTAVLALKECMESIPEQIVTEASLPAGLRLSGRTVPAPILDFAPPCRVDVVGSYLLRTLARPALNLDLAAEMPAACFAPRDVKNHRYGDKRALYLAVLSAALAGAPGVERVGLLGHRGDTSKPVLSVRLAGLPFLDVRVHAVVSASAMKASLLSPDHGNVRRHAFEGAAPQPPTPRYNAAVLEDAAMRRHLAAAHAALAGCAGAADAVVLLKAWARRRGLARQPDGVNGFLITMLLTALVQGGVVGPAMSPLQMARAFFGAAATAGARPMIVRDAPSGDDASADASPERDSAEEAAGAAAMARHFPWVLADASGALNIAARVSGAGLAEFRAHAAAARDAMAAGTVSDDAFSLVFLETVAPWAAYDRLVHIPMPRAPRIAARGAIPGAVGVPPPARAGAGVMSPRAAGKRGPVAPAAVAAADDAPAADLTEEDLLCDEPWPLAALRRAGAVAAEALGDRVSALRPMLGYDRGGAAAEGEVAAAPPTDADEDGWGAPDAVAWPLDAPPPVPARITLALDVVPDAAERAVERGPAADDAAQAAAFRAFWGERSQLRRFADRSIVECVVWPTPPRGRAALVGDILSYALRRHMRLGDAPVSVPSLDVEALLPRAAPAAGAGAGATPTSPAPVAPSAAPPTVLALAALARVAAALTAAPALPLRVTSVAPCAPGLTYTAVVEPTPHPLAGGDLEAAWSAGVREVPRVLRPLFAVVSLERSAKWPGSLEGIAAVKTALLVAMAEALAAARIDARPAPGWLDVLVDGYAFRLSLLVDRELAILREAAGRGRALLPAAMGGKAPAAPAAAGGGAAAGGLTPAAAAEAAEALERACVRAPLHASMVHAFALAHASFAGAARLAKAWLAAQMLGDEYAEELVELLVAHCYVPRQRGAPHSAAGGFIRFLRLLSTFDWAASPLLVDMNGEGLPSDRSALLAAFRAARGPTGRGGDAVVVVMPRDRARGWRAPWSSEGRPDRVVAHRAGLLAAAALRTLAPAAVGRDAPGGVGVIMRPTLSDYDAVVRLNRGLVPGAAVGAGGEAGEARSAKRRRTSGPFVLALHRRSACELLVGFDPVPALQRELSRALGGAAYVHRSGDGDALGIAWRARAAARFGGAPPRAAVSAAYIPAPAAEGGGGGDGAPASAEDAAAAAEAGRVLAALAGAIAIGGALVHSVDLPELE